MVSRCASTRWRIVFTNCKTSPTWIALRSRAEWLWLPQQNWKAARVAPCASWHWSDENDFVSSCLSIHALALTGFLCVPPCPLWFKHSPVVGGISAALFPPCSSDSCSQVHARGQHERPALSHWQIHLQ